MFPAFGGVLYVFINSQMSTNYYAKNLGDILQNTAHEFSQKPSVREAMASSYPNYMKNVAYLERMNFPLYQNTEVTYLSPGEKFWPVFLEKLQTAEKYIFLEYFTIGEGKFWNSVLDILKENLSRAMK